MEFNKKTVFALILIISLSSLVVVIATSSNPITTSWFNNGKQINFGDQVYRGIPNLDATNGELRGIVGSVYVIIDFKGYSDFSAVYLNVYDNESALVSRLPCTESIIEGKWIGEFELQSINYGLITFVVTIISQSGESNIGHSTFEYVYRDVDYLHDAIPFWEIPDYANKTLYKTIVGDANEAGGVNVSIDYVPAIVVSIGIIVIASFLIFNTGKKNKPLRRGF